MMRFCSINEKRISEQLHFLIKYFKIKSREKKALSGRRIKIVLEEKLPSSQMSCAMKKKEVNEISFDC